MGLLIEEKSMKYNWLVSEPHLGLFMFRISERTLFLRIITQEGAYDLDAKGYKLPFSSLGVEPFTEECLCDALPSLEEATAPFMAQEQFYPHPVLFTGEEKEAKRFFQKRHLEKSFRDLCSYREYAADEEAMGHLFDKLDELKKFVEGMA
jgi:hypothetical protein